MRHFREQIASIVSAKERIGQKVAKQLKALSFPICPSPSIYHALFDATQQLRRTVASQGGRNICIALV
jgi:hypothetical protein